MKKLIDFLRSTEGFNSFTFNGCHNDFSDSFIVDCYNHSTKHINMLEIAQEIYLISWSTNILIYNIDKIKYLEYYISHDFFKKRFKKSILNKVEKVIIKSKKELKWINEYKIKRKEANRILNNKSFRKLAFEKYGKKCIKCGSKNNLSLDHIISIFDGGSNDIENIQILCKSCNSSKGNKSIKY
jgi:5-methylcytosine-specific restriction endonuclease McrA